MEDRAKILQTYGIQDEFALEWTEESADSSAAAVLDSQSQLPSNSRSGTRDLSRYSLLHALVGSKSGAAGASILPADEIDPLGSTDSVMSVLRSRGIDVDSSPAVRAKYLISSTGFSPRSFLHDVHVDATYENLVNSLDYLESSVAKRSEALRELVDHEYILFVKSKSLLDSVLDQIDSTGFNASQGWGVETIKTNIDDASSKAGQVMKPVMDFQSKEERLHGALKLIEKNRYLFNLPSTIATYIKNENHDGLVREYRRGKDWYAATSPDDMLVAGGAIAGDKAQMMLQNKKIADRIWSEVEDIVDDYKKDLWKKLSATDTDHNYIQLISRLLDLGVEDNPIREWIDSQIRYLNEQVTDKFDKLRLRTNLLRMNIAGIPPLADVSFIYPIRDLSSSPSMYSASAGLCDSIEIVEMWINIRTVVEDVAATAGKVCDFWHMCREFLAGERQATLPTGYQGESETHLTFSKAEIADINQSAKELIGVFANRTAEFFAASAATNGSGRFSGVTSGLSVSNARSSGIELESPRDSLPTFVPPYANAISTAKYSAQVLALLHSAFTDLNVAGTLPQSSEIFRGVLTNIREKAIHAVCARWQDDCTKFALLEDWTRSPKNDAVTKLPGYFQNYHTAVLSGIRDIIYFTDSRNNDQAGAAGASGGSGNGELTAPPSTQLLKYVVDQFSDATLASIDTVVSSLSSSVDPSRLSMIETKVLGSHESPKEYIGMEYIDELSPEELTQDSKVLLVLSNLAEVRDTALPVMWKQFERWFNMSAREPAVNVRDSIDKMESSLYELYTRKKRTTLSEALSEGILNSGIDWSRAAPPENISKYVYECLLILVVVHSRVFRISPDLTNRIISVLYDHLLKTVLQDFRSVESFGRGGALQAVADVEFIRSAMAVYRSDSRKTAQLIYATIKDTSIDKTIWASRDGPRPIIHSLVDAALDRAELDFRCFAATE